MPTLIDSLRSRYGLKADASVGIHGSVSRITKAAGGGITAIANTASIDLVNEVVLPEGAERNPAGEPLYFSALKSILWCHDPMLPVGTYRNARLANGAWVVQFKIASTDFAQDIGTLIEDEAVNGTSIGFHRKEWGRPTDAEVKKYGMLDMITRTWAWLELSLTPTPCNPDALIIGRSAPPPEEFAERVFKAVERKAIRRDTAEAIGCKRIRRIVVLTP